MALITCPECQNVISDKASACVKCGAPVEDSGRTPLIGDPSPAFGRMNTAPPEEPRRRIWPWLLGAAVAAFFGYGFYASNTPEGKAQNRERRATELCWEEQRRRSLAPDEQRFIAGACERMEAEFRRKHGVSP